MQYKVIDSKIQNCLTQLLNKYPIMQKVAQIISEYEGKTLLVGGAVRDLLLQLPVKDIDIEVHGISLDGLQTILQQFGQVSLVGKAFGVLRLHHIAIDWSVPRSDEVGRKPHVRIDPFMSVKEAFARRDLTINAMGIDVISGHLIDPFGGYEDLKNHILRAPNEERFVEDPLRFFRVMQFIGRFNMYPDTALNDICTTMDILTVSRERIEQEFEKLFLKSERPSLGLRWLDAIGRLGEILPELAAVKGVVQSVQWHPEGDVFEHTMQTIDAAAALSYAELHEKLMLIYAALCHDLGKVSTTEENEGSLTSYGHAQEGVQLAKKMLRRITHNTELIESVLKLVRYHMEPIQLVVQKSKLSAYKRLANKLAPQATMQMLAKLALADKRGRNPHGQIPLKIDVKEVDQFLERTHEAQVLEQVEKPIITGQDVMDIIEPGPRMGKLLKKLYQIQIDEGIKDKDTLKQRARELMENKGV